MKNRKARALATVAMLAAGAAVAVPSFGATVLVNCNDKGTARMSQEQATKVVFARLGNNGRGNGGETIEALVDISTGDIILTCVKGTADENTGGRLTLRLPGGALLDRGAFFPETDPNGENRPPAP